MADVQSLKRIYRKLAELNAADPKELSDQKTWLEAQFNTRGSEADAGGFQASASSFEGNSFSGLFKGSSAEERAVALLDAIEEIDAEIAADDAGSAAPLQVATLLPRIVCAPR